MAPNLYQRVAGCKHACSTTRERSQRVLGQMHLGQLPQAVAATPNSGKKSNAGDDLPTYTSLTVGHIRAKQRWRGAPTFVPVSDVAENVFAASAPWLMLPSPASLLRPKRGCVGFRVPRAEKKAVLALKNDEQ